MPRLNWNRRRKVHEPWYARSKPDREDKPEFKTGTSRDYSRFLVDGILAAKDDLQFAGYAIVHTDGGCEPNPGAGGWGVVIDVADHKIELCGGERSTTNNRMEMTAAIVALTVLPTTCAVTIVSDSQYLVNGMSKWIGSWRRRGFKKKGEPIPNADLWRTLDALSAGRAVGWKWVRGHNGHAANERADQLASEGRRKALRAAV